ncbi:GIY-YIG nuclease family protein [Candidatus Uhrbacteria bacterium]|nr:GIY-YIG nuclease family protein [Candidatus Uhrbacteria bacterium]
MPGKTTLTFWYMYVLKSQKDGLRYVGFTGDLKKRFQEHQDGRVISTKYRRLFNLEYYEACLDEGDARAREKYFKSTAGRRFLAKRLVRFRRS